LIEKVVKVREGLYNFEPITKHNIMMKRQRKTYQSIQQRARELLSSDQKDTYIYGHLELSKVLKVSPATIYNWRTTQAITGQQVAPTVWRYHLGKVCTELLELNP